MRCAFQMCWGIQVSYLRMCLSWLVRVSQATSTAILEESHVVSLLPTINLHATDPTVIYSLLSFLTEQCKIRESRLIRNFI